MSVKRFYPMSKSKPENPIANPNLKSRLTEKPIPSSRISRFLKVGSMAGAITGNVIKNGVGAALKAQRPSAKNTLLNLNNAKTITKHLAQMRGAAMKLGQMLSMDAGELLPPEWEPILALLREQANSMPNAQLQQVLKANWGENWQAHFSEFSFAPIAAASIGQVHKGVLKSGETVAVKVQYPGVAQSIDSDIDNVAGLLSMTRLIPKGLDIKGILEQAKEQLKQEADYESELRYLQHYKSLLAGDERYIVPKVHTHLSNQHILCMEFIEARPMAELAYETRATKTTILENLFDLVFKELFVFRFTQSDPNYANFLFNDTSKQLVLLDFGACRTISEHASQGYFDLAKAMQAQNSEDILTSLIKLGLLNAATPQDAKEIVVQACLTASEALQSEQYNFKAAQIVQRLQQQTMGLISEKNAIASPNFDVALINRKVSGTVLLANKMNVDLSLQGLLAGYIR